jgi:hypothetical protein
VERTASFEGHGCVQIWLTTVAETKYDTWLEWKATGSSCLIVSSGRAYILVVKLLRMVLQNC